MKRLLLTATLLLAAFGAHAIEFIENDYAKALAAAKARNVPIFVETWAPW